MTDVPTIEGAPFEQSELSIVIKLEDNSMSETDEIVPEMMVTVQVEEINDTQPLDFDSVSFK